MSEIGIDIKEVIAEVGTAVTIIRSSGNISGEFCKPKLNAQVTKPFIREFFVEAWLSYDTSAVGGDYIQFADGRTFMLMNRTPHLFEGDVTRYECVLYKCNVTGRVLRPLDARQGVDMVTSWTLIRDNTPALITEALYGNQMDDDEDFGRVSVSEDDFYIPHWVGIKEKDRFWVSDDEYYLVEVVRTHRFDGVDLAILGEDTRGPVSSGTVFDESGSPVTDEAGLLVEATG